MEKETIINQVVQKAYINLTQIAKLHCYMSGGYFGVIIPENQIKEIIDYTDEIINNLFWKFCDELSSKITIEDTEMIMYKSFCFLNPNENLVKDCFKLVNNVILNKKSSNETTLLTLLKPLEVKYSKKDLEQTLDIIFDILLDYYIIKN